MRYKKIDPQARTPFYATEGAACFDIASIEDTFIPPGQARTLRTGLAFEVPKGSVLLVYSRSGHGFKAGVRLCNSTGVIDSDYRGELMVRLHNDGTQAMSFYKGDHVAQGMLTKAPQITLIEATDLSETKRGANGLGSTGA